MTTSTHTSAGGSSNSPPNQPPNNAGAATTEPEKYALGHTFKGAPFELPSNKSLPDWPAAEDFKAWGLLDVLMRKKCITSAEINKMFDQTVTNVLVAKLRDDIVINVLRLYSKRFVTHWDGAVECKRNDEYYICELHRAHILSLIGGVKAWEKMLPAKAKDIHKHFGRRMDRKDRERAAEELDEAIRLYKAGVRLYSREQKREDKRYARRAAGIRPRKLQTPGQSAFAF